MKKFKFRADITAVTIVAFFVCIILVSIMLMQFRTVEQTDITEIENMRESELRVALSEWKTKYEEVSTQLEDVNKRIEEYNKKIQDNEEASELVEEELKESNVLVGKTDVEGEGVIITINSTDESPIYAGTLLTLVNELRYAGAEAISINEVRVLSSTAIVDLSSYISVNGQRLEAPYVIKAIGDKEYLSSILNLKGSGFIDIYKSEGKDITMEKSNKVKIPKSNGDNGEFEIEHMQEATKKE